MKKLNSLIIMLLAVCVFYACRKNDNPKLPEGIVTAVLPQLAPDSTSDVLIQDMTKFKAVFSAGNYFPNSIQPKEMDLYIAMNGDALHRKLYKKLTGPFPVKVTITGQEIATMFALDINNVPEGSSFTVSVDVLQEDGTLIPAYKYPVTAAGDTVPAISYGSDASNFPGFTPTQTYDKACPLNTHLYAKEQSQGGSTMTVNDPDFWEDIYDVQAYTGSGADTVTFTLVGWIQDPSAKIVLNGDAKTQSITVKSQTYLPTLPGTSYTKPTVSGKGKFSTCDTTMILSLTNTVAQGSFGTGTVTIYPKK